MNDTPKIDAMLLWLGVWGVFSRAGQWRQYLWDHDLAFRGLEFLLRLGALSKTGRAWL